MESLARTQKMEVQKDNKVTEKAERESNSGNNPLDKNDNAYGPLCLLAVNLAIILGLLLLANSL